MFLTQMKNRKAQQRTRRQRFEVKGRETGGRSSTVVSRVLGRLRSGFVNVYGGTWPWEKGMRTAVADPVTTMSATDWLIQTTRTHI